MYPLFDGKNYKEGEISMFKRIFTIFLLFIGLAFSSYVIENVKEQIPDKINIVVNEKKDFDFDLPIEGTIKIKEVSDMQKSNIPKDSIKINLNKPFSMTYKKTGSYNMACRLFGIIKLKDMQIDVVNQQYVIPCGNSIGIYVKTDGILVIGTGTITAMDGLNYEPSLRKINSGDYIMAINNIELNNKNELIKLINEYGKEDVILTVRRNNELIDIKVKPVETAINEYKLGIWVRDNTQGIGTLTFIEDDGTFGALGHGINDADTSLLMEVSGGKLYDTQIVSIVKGQKGIPGELTGTIEYSEENVLGEINKNTSNGIFGISSKLIDKMSNMQKYEVCMKQDIKEGKAYIRSDLTGKMEDYEINIEEINMNGSSINKGMVIKVTDLRLLSLTGGIVQGLSGAPIIQDGKICGAVTHVFVQDPTKGYGIFIEEMCACSGKE